MLEEVEEPKGPPQATIKRRAQSYTDFHHAAQAVLDGKHSLDRDKPHERALDLETVKNKEVGISDDIDFAEWYQHLEHELLESSHDDYTYASTNASRVQRLTS